MIYGSIIDPIANLFADLLAFYYKLVPNYGAAIIMLTLTAMVLLAPLNLKAVRSQLAMASLAPDLKKLRDKYPNPADRQEMNVEMMKMYKDAGVSPVSGCLPILVQMPIFFGLYSALRGLSNKKSCTDSEPRFLGHGTLLYRNLMDQRVIATNKCKNLDWVKGRDDASAEFVNLDHAVVKMKTVGLDIASSASHMFSTSGLAKALPFFILIVIMVALNFLQQRQMMKRSNTPNQNPAMLIVMKVFPLIFGVFSIGFPAAMVLYWLTQSLFRIGQQSAMYRFDPVIRKHHHAAKERHAIDAKSKEKVAGKSNSKDIGKSSQNGSGKKTNTTNTSATKSSNKNGGGALVADATTKPLAEQPKGAPTPKRSAQRRAKGGR